jgi:hypothetical protein
MKNFKYKISNIKFLLSLLVFLCLPFLAKASQVYPVAANQNVYEGQAFSVDWFLNTQNQIVNTLDLSWDFSPSDLELVSIEPGNSVISLWVNLPKLNQAGKVALTGGIPGGVNGENLPVVRMVFLAKKSGQARVNLNPDSKILLNDGQGSLDALELETFSAPVLPKNFSKVEVISITQPDPTTWYKNKTVKFVVKADSKPEYSYSFSSNSDIIPPFVAMDISKEIIYENLPDGVYYFKVAEKLNSQWQEAAVFRVQLDSTPP